MDDALVIGVDCGGTRTRAVLAGSSGTVLGFGEAGPGNARDHRYESVGPRRQLLSRLAHNIDEAVQRAYEHAGFSRSVAQAAFLGLAGVATSDERDAVRHAIRHLELAPDERLRIDHDLRIAQAGAFGGGPGMVLIIGTGSCCYGRSARGEEWRAGGWGSPLDDGGSATDLGLRAVRAVIRESDGRGEPTTLSRELIHALGLNEPRGLLALFTGNTLSRKKTAALAPLVTRAAQEGDAVALAILEDAVSELAEMVRAVHDRLSLSEVALLGGVLDAGAILTEPLQREIQTHVPECSPVQPMMPALLGAAWLAINLLEAESQASLEQLRSTGSRILQGR